MNDLQSSADSSQSSSAKHEDLPASQESNKQRPIVVGIGASAGGLNALTGFLENIPDDPGVAFVIVQHLDPNHSSSLVDILRRRTKLPVNQVDQEMLVEVNQLYVIPPGRYLSIKDGRLQLSEPQDNRGSRMAIDYFFISLAEYSSESSIGIVLSGTGTDGTAGLREIKHYGGLTIVQEPNEAEHAGMPNSAIDAVHIDYVLPVNQIGFRLKRYVDFCRRYGPLSAQVASRSENADLAPVLDLIRRELKQDFRRYRKNTLLRRIQRRMGLLQLEELSDYVKVLDDNSAEREALRRDLLIGVTRFFRDQIAWQQLEQQLDVLVERASRQSPIRVWCAGCATGEEAYSIAMLLLEKTEGLGKDAPFQIFATDVAEDALQIARSGVYPEAIMKDVPLGRLRRFFNKEPGTYRISKQLRESVVFASQNVLAQPPFAKLDLVLCRNLLIYLEREAQDRVLDVFQFGLKEGGILFLGNTESVGRAADLFSPISKKLRLFRRTSVKSWPPVETGYESNQQPLLPNSDIGQVTQRQGRRESGLGACVQRQVLQQLDRAVAVVNEKGKLLFVEGCADLYLKLNTGELSTELPDLIEVSRRGIKAKLRDGVRKAWDSKHLIDIEGRVQRDGGFKRCHMRISRLLGRPEDPAVLIVFTPLENVVSKEALVFHESHDSLIDETVVSEHTMMELEHELATTREQLNSSIAELESANEALKASNEEAMTMNEELQSSNEELETSKEELQSLNEELTTLNNQLEIKVGELEESTNDLENIIASTDVPTIFLDSQFRIRRHTPSCVDLFRFIAGDLGRPLADISTRFEDPNLVDDAEKVLRDLRPRDRQIKSHDGNRWYHRRMLPYRTEDGRIQGVVMTFTEITDLLEAQQKAEQQLAQNKNIYSTAPIGLAFVDCDQRFISINERLASLSGLPAEAHLAQKIVSVMPTTFAEAISELCKRVLASGKPVIDSEVTGPSNASNDGRIFLTSCVPVNRPNGEIAGVNIVAQEITERKLAEQNLRRSEHRYRTVIDATSAITWACPASGLYIEPQLSWMRFTGQTVEESLGSGWQNAVHPEDVEEVIREWNESIKTFRPFRSEHRIRRRDGQYRWMSTSIAPIPTDKGEVKEWFGMSFDVTDRKKSEQSLIDLNRRLEVAQLAGGVGAWEWDIDAGTVQWSNSLFDALGYDKDSFDNRYEQIIALIHHEDRSRVIGHLNQVVAGHKSRYQIEHRILHHDGHFVWLSASGIPTKDTSGRVVSICGAAINITEQKLWETHLRDREAYLRRVLDNQLAFVALMDPEGTTLEVSQSALDTVGIAREDAIGRKEWDQPWWNFDEASRQQILQDYDNVRRGAIIRRDAIWWTNDNESLEVEYMLSPTYDDDGTLRHVIASAVDISDRKQAEYRMRHSEERYRALIDATAEIVWTTTASGEVELDSPSWREYTGQTFEQWKGWGWLDAIHPEDREVTAEKWRRAVITKSDCRMEYRVRHCSGEYRWTAVRAVPVLLDDGSVREWVGLNVDIQPQKNAEGLIRKSEGRLSKAMEIAKAGSWEATPGANEFRGSELAMRLYGFAPETETTLEDILAVVHPNDQATVRLALKESADTGVSFNVEMRIVQPDGTVRWVASHAEVDRGSEPPHLMGFVQDITSRKQTQLELLASERRLAAALEGGKMGLWEWDLQRGSCVWNDREYEIFGLEPGDGEVAVSIFFEHVHEEDSGELRRVLRQVTEDAHEFYHEARIRKIDGQIRWIAFAGQVERNEQGIPLRLVGVNYDITEPKIASEALRESDRRKDEFLATLAHELRNPLAPLRSGLEIIRTSANDPEMIAETLQTMHRQLSHLVALVDDLLDVSRISKGKLRLRRENLRFFSVVKDAIEISRPMVEIAGHRFHVDLPDRDAMLNGDPHRLSQILSNLINNAAKYTPSGGNVTVTARIEDREAVISVTDDGIGIESDQLVKVFTMFAQIEREESLGYAGLGIGLSLVESLVEMHGGKISVLSPGAGKGATFTVRLPIERVLEEPVVERGDNQEQMLSTLRRVSKVLVVDDNYAAAKTLSIVIKKLGNDVRIASDGVEGVQAAEEFKPDLVIMDIGMPVMDGYAAARAMRAESWGKKMLLVALTGWGQDEDFRKTKEAGFDQHLVKPIEPEVIHRLLYDLGNSHEDRHESEPN
ncbi:PAS domain S-box protein [Stieleria sp. JC731]|uniref:PAS domain S-box protein n=1 Tax=Pirellulaceae TaxID=2691357 RepID=UPI001E3B27FA|nr:PAS domain S-box protein [Stieleria sp. JC731]MCC9603197.1 PAS domain S-box protein [Stieleria sp. JC731]